MSWIDHRQLSLAPSKCEHLSIARNASVSNKNVFKLGSHHIKSVPLVRDLGIIISNDLKWKCHVSHIYATASMCAYQVLHSFSTKNVWTLLKAFNTYVRPKLEYNTSVWNPFYLKDVRLIESVQKKFTRQICIRCNIRFNSYCDRLLKLNLHSLEYRRLEFDLILMFKICHNLSELKFNDYFKFRKTGYNLRQHCFTVESLFHPKRDQYRHFFFNRIVNIWNYLPEIIVSAATLPVFKARLRKFDLHDIANLTF